MNFFQTLLVFLVFFFAIGLVLILSLFWFSSSNTSTMDKTPLKTWVLERIPDFKVRAAIIAVFLVLFSILLYRLWIGKISNIDEFKEGVLVEMVGMFFDAILLVLALTWLESRGETKREIKRYEEQLDDYRGWYDNEAAFRVAGIIKRLKEKGVEKIEYKKLQLGRCEKEIIIDALESYNPGRGMNFIRPEKTRRYFDNAHLSGVRLKGVNLSNSSFEKATFRLAHLENCNLVGSILRNADLHYTDFSNSKLTSADFSGADLSYAIFEDAKIDYINLTNANIKRIKLEGAKVANPSWIKDLPNIEGRDLVQAKYFVDQSKQIDNETLKHYYLIKSR